LLGKFTKQPSKHLSNIWTGAAIGVIAGVIFVVYDNANVQLPSHGFKTKKEARKQEIAVALSQSKRQNKPMSFYFA
jgi:hypothetical protein